MPNLANYPKGFSPYPLYVPTPPVKTVKRQVELLRQDSINRADIPEDCETILAYGDEIVCVKWEEVPNPNYESGLTYYERCTAEYQERLSIQKEWLPKWEAEQAAEREAGERGAARQPQGKIRKVVVAPDGNFPVWSLRTPHDKEQR
jgi:hypothetical protein